MANIYTMVFKNMLKRVDLSLFQHIYNNLMLDESVWIFKWFITCYIYSFPLEVIRYVWDAIVELGAIGLVYFAVGMVMELKNKLKGIDDLCDVS